MMIKEGELSIETDSQIKKKLRIFSNENSRMFVI